MTFTASVSVVDNTRWPIAALTLMYWQDYGDGPQDLGYLQYLLPADAKAAESTSRAANSSRELVLTKTDPFRDPSDQEPIDQDVSFEQGHNIYWIVAWQNMHDPAIYYLVKEPTIWEELELAAIKEMNKAIGDLMDFCTESDIGRAYTTAADYYAKSVFDAKSGNMKIENKINTDAGKSTLTITLNADRATGSFDSPGHQTRCGVRFYLKDDPTKL